jgi:hypothetical protein
MKPSRIAARCLGMLCMAVLPPLASAATQMDSLRNLLNSPTGQIMARSYIKGSVDTWSTVGAICLPPGMTTEGMENVVLTYIAIHPNDPRRIPEVVQAAFAQYRCTRGK